MRTVAIHYIRTFSGADVYFEQLIDGLRGSAELDCHGVPHASLFRIFPFLLRLVPVRKADFVITNLEYAWVFRRRCDTLIAVAHQCVSDPGYRKKGLPQKMYHRAVLEPGIRRSVRCADKIIGCCEAISRLIERQYGASCSTVCGAVDTDLFRPNGPKRSTDKQKTVLFVGNPIRRKGVDLLPDIARMLGDGYRIRCILGPRNAAVPSALHSNVNIDLISGLRRGDLPREYRSADVLLLPSRHEGLPLTALEAMACAVPCITSGVNGLQELLTPDCGIICSEQTPQAYADAIRALCDDATRRNAMGSAARKRIEERYALRDQLERFRSILCAS